MKTRVFKFLPLVLTLVVTACGVKTKSSSNSVQSSSSANETSEQASSSNAVQSSSFSNTSSEQSSSASSSSVHVHTPGVAVQENTVDPTCLDEGGYDRVVRCTGCGEILSSQHYTLPPLNHDFGEPTYAWNSDYTKCTATRVCSRDSSHIETETVDSVYSVVSPNNCGVEGSAAYTATFTNSAFVEQVHNVTLDALEHNYIESVIPATDDEEGYTLHTCSRCQNSYRDHITSAVNKFTYVNYNTGYRITGYDGDADYFTVPGSYNDLPVLTADETLFENRKESVKEVVFCEGITRLNNSMFYQCISLKRAVIPNSVEAIGQYFFRGCSSLEEITIPFIGQSPLYDKALCTIFGGSNYDGESFVPASLKTVIIGEACTYIPYHAFHNLSNITSITIGENVTTIDNYAFWGATGIKTIHFPKKVENICADAFYTPNVDLGLELITVDSENPNLTAVDGVLYNKDQTSLIMYPPQKADTAFEIPASVKIIGDYAFFKCKKLTSITMSNNVEQLGNRSFAQCTKITSLDLSDKIEEIPDSYCIAYCDELRTINLPEGLKRIGSYTFAYDSKLTSLVIPSTVTYIGTAAFSNTTIATLTFVGSMRDITMDSAWSKYLSSCPEIICGGSSTPYGIQVNGGTPILVSRFGFDNYHQEFVQFRVGTNNLKAGDTFTLYDAAKQEAWAAPIDPYSFGGTEEAPIWSNYLDFDGNVYTLKQDLAYLNLFIKIGGTNCKVYMSI